MHRIPTGAAVSEQVMGEAPGGEGGDGGDGTNPVAWMHRGMRELDLAAMMGGEATRPLVLSLASAMHRGLTAHSR